MSEFVQCFLIMTVFLGFIYAVFCGYQIQIKNEDKEMNAKKDSNNKKK